MLYLQNWLYRQLIPSNGYDDNAKRASPLENQIASEGTSHGEVG